MKYAISSAVSGRRKEGFRYMKQIKRALSILLAGVMVLSLLTGCAMPKLVIGGTPKTVGTISGRDIATGEYLAYLYLAYEEAYYSYYTQNYMMIQYGMAPDFWEQQMTYGTGETAQTVSTEEYIRLQARDMMATQEAYRLLMEKYNIQYDAEDLADFEESLVGTDWEPWLEMGINQTHMTEVYRSVGLSQTSLLKGLYGKGGQREVPESDLRQYFTDNYVAYKMISVSLTDSTSGEALADDEKKAELDRLNGYLDTFNKDRNFEAIVDQYAKDTGTAEEELTPSTDKDNFRLQDVTQTTEEALMTEIRTLAVGSAGVLEYESSSGVPMAALILRLDINDTERSLFADETDSILQKLKEAELEEEVAQTVATVVVDLKNAAINKCKPQNFEQEEQ